MIGRVCATVGNSLPRSVRRFILDRLGGAQLLEKLVRDDLIRVPLTDSIELWANAALHSGMIDNGKFVYEPEVVSVVRQRLRNGDTFYDVGANIGVFSYLSIDRIGSEGTVIAFEPEPNNLACLTRSASEVDVPARVTVMGVALSDAEGIVEFDRRGGAFSGRIANDNRSDGKSGCTIEVPAKSIDGLVEAGSIPPPNFIKLDVEGAEGVVLHGASATLKKYKPEILVELHHFDPSGVQKCFQTLDACGYRLYKVDPAADAFLSPLTRVERGAVRHMLAVAAGPEPELS